MTAALDELPDWLAANWDPELTLRAWWARLVESGWSQPSWPVEWHGRGLDRAGTRQANRVIREFGAVTGPGGFSGGMAGPVLLDHGTDEQKARFLQRIADGTDAYCQLFSEPNAGSDLAGLQCRAERDGDQWVVNGQKVWTSGGQHANVAMLVARTNVDVPKHAGLSYFFIDVTQPGVEMRPLREMTGRAFFNEVFLTDARIPAGDLIGGEGNGWAVANTTLAYERALSSGGEGTSSATPGPIARHLDRRAGDFSRPPTTDAAPVPTASLRLTELARQVGRSGNPLVRQGLAQLHTLERLSAWNGQRGMAGLPNLAKMMQNHAIRLGRTVTFDILQTAGTLHSYDDDPADEFGDYVETALFSAGPPIYGGSDQIQRNIVGERILGLPREPSTDKGVPFRDLPKN